MSANFSQPSFSQPSLISPPPSPPLGRAVPPLKLGILASGTGSNFAAIAQAIAAGELPARAEVLVYNNPGAKVAERAAAFQIPTRLLNHRDYKQREDHDRQIVAVLREFGVEWVVMAGWMRIVTPVLIDAFPERIINLHPSLLPSFPGVRAVEQALAAGVKISGCTVHLVVPAVDSGPILCQAAVPVLSEDTPETLHARIQVQEHRILLQTIAQIAQQQTTTTPTQIMSNHYQTELIPGQTLSLEQRGEQTIVTVSSVTPGQQQQASSSFTTGGWLSAPSILKTDRGVVIELSTVSGDYRWQIQGNSIRPVLGAPPSSATAQPQPLRPPSQPPLPPLPKLEMGRLEMGEMKMSLEPMQMQMGNMQMQMGNPLPRSGEPIAQRFCSQCGQPIVREQSSIPPRFCAACGHSLG
uniref:Phosphoribosylglycinamide formyltransferase n=1 Tax=Cyanothece sp. (strain PCC 7425 / ATCC 29141) TaxID=395961 RepID=B8HN73_CYAP4